MLKPRTVDNVTLTEETDFAGFVRAGLLGGGGLGSLGSDCFPLDAVERVYAELADSPYAERLEHGVAMCLTDPDPFVRAQALVFFHAHPYAVTDDRLRELLAGDRRLFRAVPSLAGTGPDLEWQLLDLLAYRVAEGDPWAVALACAEVLEPSRAEPLLGALVEAKPEWVLSHAEEIAQNTPTAGKTLLILMQTIVDDLAEFARRIIPLCHGDAHFESDIARFIDEEDVRDELLGLFVISRTGDSSETP